MKNRKHRIRCDRCKKFVREFDDLGTLEGKLAPSIPLSHSVCFKCYRKFDDWDDWVRKDNFIQHQKYFFDPK